MRSIWSTRAPLFLRFEACHFPHALCKMCLSLPFCLVVENAWCFLFDLYSLMLCHQFLKLLILRFAAIWLDFEGCDSWCPWHVLTKMALNKSIGKHGERSWAWNGMEVHMVASMTWLILEDVNTSATAFQRLDNKGIARNDMRHLLHLFISIEGPSVGNSRCSWFC